MRQVVLRVKAIQLQGNGWSFFYWGGFPYFHKQKAQALRLNSFFRLPELLLLAGMVMGPILPGKDTIDIQIHDTLFVFGQSHGWLGNDFFVYLNVLLLFSWLTHIYLRKHGSLPATWRWVHVSLSFLFTLSLVVLAVVLDHAWRRDPGELLFHIEDWDNPMTLSSLMAIGTFLFVLLQLIFWVTASVALFRRRR